MPYNTGPGGSDASSAAAAAAAAAATVDHNIDEALTSSLASSLASTAHSREPDENNTHSDKRRPSIANLLSAAATKAPEDRADLPVDAIAATASAAAGNDDVVVKPTRGLDPHPSAARPQSYGYGFAGYQQPQTSYNGSTPSSAAASAVSSAGVTAADQIPTGAGSAGGPFFQQAYFNPPTYPNYYNGQPYPGAPAGVTAAAPTAVSSGSGANYFGADNSAHSSSEPDADPDFRPRRKKARPVPNTGILNASDGQGESPSSGSGGRAVSSNSNSNNNSQSNGASGGGERSPERPYNCTFPNCSWAFARLSDQRRHLKSHYKPTFQCPYWKNDPTCHRNGGAFNRLDVLKRHLKLVHFVQFKENENGWCRVCNKMFPSSKQFIDHCEACANEIRPAEWKLDINDQLVPYGRTAANRLMTVNSQQPFDDEGRSIMDLTTDGKRDNEGIAAQGVDQGVNQGVLSPPATAAPAPVTAAPVAAVPRGGSGRKKTLSQSIQAGHHSV